MKGSDKLGVGQPSIQITPPSDDKADKEADKTSGETGKSGFRKTRKITSSPVMRRKPEGARIGTLTSRRATIINGRISEEKESLQVLKDDDSYLSGESDTELGSLSVRDVKLIEKTLNPELGDRPQFSVQQVQNIASQLAQDARGFRKVAASTQRHLATHPFLDDEVKKTILEQCDRVQKFSADLEEKLSIVQESAKKHKQTFVTLKRSGSGISFGHKDIRAPKKSETPDDDSSIASAEIIRDSYKYLLEISRLWKMEWPSFEILTSFAALYAGIEVDQLAVEESSEAPDTADPLVWRGLMEIESRLTQLHDLSSQLKALTKKSSDLQEPGVKELLGTIYSDAESRLKPMPMDYYYQRGGEFEVRKKPLVLFEQRLDRVIGAISEAQKQKDFLKEQLENGKDKFTNSQGQEKTVSDEVLELEKKKQAINVNWSISLPSVQRMYSEGFRKSARRRK